MTAPPRLVVVRAFSQPHEAHLACSALHAAGLDATVADANMVAADWLVSNAIGGVKVVVREEDEAAAREVLDGVAEVEKDDHVDEGSASEEHGDASCPRCGSTNTVQVEQGKRLTFLTWLAVGVPLFPIRRRRSCESCGFVVRA